MLGDATGACGCCGMRLGLDADNKPIAIYRAANSETRDIYLLTPSAGGTWSTATIDVLPTKTCPMSTMTRARAGAGVIAAWDNGGEISIEPLDGKGSGV